MATNPAASPAGPAETVAPSPSPSAVGPIQFLPVVGIPPDKAALLSQALAERAQAAGIAIQAAETGIAPLRLKGYLSAVREPEDTLVVFVWDVVDPAGERMRRIQDQVRVRGTGHDAWSVVDANALSQIAERTMAALRAPVDGRIVTN